MNVSVLLPSRGNPEGFWKVYQNLSSLASDPKKIEIILMLDADEPKLPNYKKVFEECSHKGKLPAPINILRNTTIKGYGNLHLMFDECARHASGDVLLAYNDDVICETKDWDRLYKMFSEINPLRPISSIVHGDHFKWAFPAITRETYSRVGQFCPFGIENFDRVWCATAKAMELDEFWTTAEVNLVHHRTDPEHGSEDRKQYIRGVMAEWDARQRIWDETGRKVAELLK